MDLFNNVVLWEYAAAFWGFSIGAILPHLIIYTWAWFPVQQIPLRVFAWSILVGKVGPLLYGWPTFYAIDHVVVPLIFYYLGTMGSGIIGLPQDATWLEASKKLQTIRLAALGRPISDSHQQQLYWSLPKVPLHLLSKDPKRALILVNQSVLFRVSPFLASFCYRYCTDTFLLPLTLLGLPLRISLRLQWLPA